MDNVKVALLQFRWKNTPEENLTCVLNLIDQIGKRKQVDLVCLPEFFLGPPFYFPGKKHLKGIVDDTIPGKVTDALAALAKKHSFYILGGTIVERDGSDYYNTSVVIDNKGEIVAKSRKIHCFSAELVTIKSGVEQTIVDTPFGKIGICVCSDFWIQEMPRMLALKGAEIIYVSGSSLKQNINLVRPCVLANSAHNVCYTLYTSVIGKVTGLRGNDSKFLIEFGGYSCVASPLGMLAKLSGEEKILFATLDMEDLRQHRQVDAKFKRTLYWCLWGRRPELYKDILNPYVEAQTSLKDIVKEYLQDQGRI